MKLSSPTAARTRRKVSRSDRAAWLRSPRCGLGKRKSFSGSRRRSMFRRCRASAPLKSTRLARLFLVSPSHPIVSCLHSKSTSDQQSARASCSRAPEYASSFRKSARSSPLRYFARRSGSRTSASSKRLPSYSGRRNFLSGDFRSSNFTSLAIGLRTISPSSKHFRKTARNAIKSRLTVRGETPERRRLSRQAAIIGVVMRSTLTGPNAAFHLLSR
jgi:hypothetical protein